MRAEELVFLGRTKSFGGFLSCSGRANFGSVVPLSALDAPDLSLAAGAALPDLVLAMAGLYVCVWIGRWW